MDEEMDIKCVKIENGEESEVIMEETNGSLQQQPSSSSQRNSQNGLIRQGPKLEEDEPMDQSGPPPDLEPVRPFTPPLRERTRSRSRERSAELQENLDQILRSEIELKKENKAKDNDYLHNVYYINDIEAVELPKSASQRISKVFGYIRYAVEAFENGSHIFYSSDNYEERRAISDYVRRKTIAEYKSLSRLFIIVRNEFIVHERFGELSILHSGVCLVPFDADLHKLPDNQRCYLSTIETFRTFYLKFPGFFNKDDVFVFEDFQYFGDSCKLYYFFCKFLI
uniref:Uncharacterized protein n=1 Tax=Panagrolaimus davidi TaxID=227884 RepID=A0A914PG30_9BILA